MKNFCRALCCCTCCCSKKQKEPLIPEISVCNPVINDDEEVVKKEKNENKDKDNLIDENKPNEEQNKEESKENETKEETAEEKKEELKEVEEKKEEVPIQFYDEKFYYENINDDSIFEEKFYREDEKGFKRFVSSFLFNKNRQKGTL